MASLGPTISQLDTSWRTLSQRWEDVKTLWNDPVRMSFEQDYWTPLAGQLPAVQREMERLAQVVAGAQRGVE